MRYFMQLAYRGTNYFGWQIQPKQISVQAEIQNALSTLLRMPIEITGCGRTDTGVHASSFYAHFDFPADLPQGLNHRINKILPDDIVVFSIFPVEDDAHSRYDAIGRKYRYFIKTKKHPFTTDLAYHFPFAEKLNHSLLHEAASLISKNGEFYPLSKTGSDVKNYRCEIMESKWYVGPDGLIYEIEANRFLRGMVRLIVGMCINVALGKLTLPEVEDALENQVRLRKSQSVPPQGLFLTDIKYPYPVMENSVEIKLY